MITLTTKQLKAELKQLKAEGKTQVRLNENLDRLCAAYATATGVAVLIAKTPKREILARNCRLH